MPLRGRGEANWSDPIPLSTEGEWVRVKKVLSRDDELAIQGIATKYVQLRGALSGETAEEIMAGVTLEDVDAEGLIKSVEFIRLERAIVAWSFDEPVTVDNIHDLSHEDCDLIHAALDVLQPPARTADDVQDLSVSGAATG